VKSKKRSQPLKSTSNNGGQLKQSEPSTKQRTPVDEWQLILDQEEEEDDAIEVLTDDEVDHAEALQLAAEMQLPLTEISRRQLREANLAAEVVDPLLSQLNVNVRALIEEMSAFNG